MFALLTVASNAFTLCFVLLVSDQALIDANARATGSHAKAEGEHFSLQAG